MRHYHWSLYRLLVVTGCLLLPGCLVIKSYPQLKPVDPPVTYTLAPETVNSLAPTFKWSPYTEPGTTYDFVICNVGASGGRNLWRQGNIVYYKEALNGTEHTIEYSLTPDTIYLWSVRVRVNGKVLPWSTTSFSATAAIGGASSVGRGWFFSFRTPKLVK